MPPTLTLSPLTPPPGSSRWKPFGHGPEAHRGFDRSWWEYRFFTGAPNDWYFSVLDHQDREVARLELDETFPIEAYPSAARAVRRPVLEVEFFEVRDDHRLTGVGTAAVALALASFQDRQLVAMSEQADEFWASLGWSRHRHRDDAGPREFSQPLYVAP